MVAQFFQLNRRLCVPRCPQEMHALSEKRDARMLPRRSLSRCHNEITQKFQKSNWIRQVVDHECRERFGGIQRDISALLNSRSDIQAVGLQSWKKAVPG